MKKDNSLLFEGSSFIQKIIDFFFPPVEEKLSGTLVVSGEGYLEFRFHQHPSNAFVYFAGECDPVPCDPGIDDFLDWKIVHHKNHHMLVIEWNVNSARTIEWKVCI